jgi:hypothetical protein
MVRQRGATRRGCGVALILLAIAGCAKKAAPVEDEAVAVTALEKMGGRVTVDAKRLGNPVVGVDLRDTQVTVARVKELEAARPDLLISH